MALPGCFSRQEVSLLSGVEPLPPSSPPSPHRSLADFSSSSSPPLYPASSFSSFRRAASSQVTAQLYASLRHSRGELGEEQTEEPHRNLSSGEQELERASFMASEVDDLADEMSRKLEEGVEASGRMEASTCISQMESLRCHLKNMLTRNSHGDLPDKEQQSDCTSTLLSARPMQELSPPLSLTGLEGLFPRYSSLYNAAPTLPDLQLRDALEKETARRKHLERHIQNLQNEMLELQQRLSLALTADRRKDAMIQQLDQTLAMVVGGWKQQDHRKEEAMHHLKQEKEEAQRARAKEQEAVARVQQELAEVLESLEREKQVADERQIELQRQVDEQAARISQLQAQQEAEGESRAQERRELESLHYRMQEQQRCWEERERALQEECQRVQEEGMAELEKEKAVTQQAIQTSQQFQAALSSLQSDVLRSERELQVSHGDRDALQMELNLEKARNESEKVRIESEHKMKLEEELTERLAAVHKESAQHLCSVREHHRRQLLNITSQHETELSSQLSQFKSELQERERRHREVIMDYELKLSRSEEHGQRLSRSLRRLETERAEMLAQLQDVMKSHWSQTLRVLSAKAPYDVPSPLAPSKQIEPMDGWTKHTGEGSYGEEARSQANQGEVGASDVTSSTKELNECALPASTAHRLLQNNSSSNEPGGRQFNLNNSQHMEDGNRTSQRSTSNRQSVNVNSVNISQLLNERGQDLISKGQFNEPISRYMGDGSQFCSKSAVHNISGGQSLLGVSQGNGQPSKVAEITDNASVRSVLNGADSELKGQCLTQQTHTEQGLKATLGQPSMAGSLDLIQRELKDISILSSGPNQRIPFHDGSNPSLVRADSHPSVMGHTSFIHTGKNHFNDAYPLSVNRRLGQPSVMKDHTSHGQPKGVIDKAVGELIHLKEIRQFIAQMGHLESVGPFPLLSPTSKAPIQGPNKELKIHPDNREESLSGLQLSPRITEPEEHFYPMQMEELSHSFSSHHGFFPLEPDFDATVTGNVSTTLPQMSPEHPFQEEHPFKTTELPPNWEAEGDRSTSNPLLQYYIRMLLDRTPGDPLNELEKESSRANPDVTALCQYLQTKENQPSFRSEEKPPNVSKPHSVPKKQPMSKAPEAVKKEVLRNQRRQNVAKPLKRVSACGGRSGVWK